ncbi:hypothetical protein LXL04_004383 [Taraxacum kok-saghyz]
MFRSSSSTLTLEVDNQVPERPYFLTFFSSFSYSQIATSFNLPTLEGPLLHKSHFLGQTQFINLNLTHTHAHTHTHTHIHTYKSSKANRWIPKWKKGLREFLEKNPPPKKPPPPSSSSSATTGFSESLVRKLKALELPLLMPGMIAIVKNRNQRKQRSRPDGGRRLMVHMFQSSHEKRCRPHVLKSSNIYNSGEKDKM